MENPNFVSMKKQQSTCCCKCNKITIAITVLVIIVLVALIIGLSLYFTIGQSSSSPAVLDATKRVDCAPDQTTTISESACESRGCLFSSDTNGIIGAPMCYYPPSSGYQIKNQVNQTIYLSAPQNLYAPFGQPIPNLTMTYEFPSKTMLHFKIVDSSNDKRYQVPIKLNKISEQPAKDTESDLVLQTGANGNTFSFQIFRRNSTAPLIDTSIGGFVYSDQFIQLATYLPTENVYGFGENTHQNLKHDLTQFKTWPMFSRDQAPYSLTENRGNLYGVHPFYLVVEKDHKAHGVFILNSNAQEYTLGPGPSLTYRTIGGILDVYVFSGPTPSDVVHQYWSIIGYPLMPAYWSLGFQLCRYGYANTQEVEDVVARTHDAGIPQDVQYVDIDYMDGDRDFTLDQQSFGDLPDYVITTQTSGLKWIFIVDPAISVGSDSYETFVSGLDGNVFITWPNKSFVPDLNNNYTDTENTLLMLGTVWPNNNTVFPDFFKNATNSWWIQQLVNFHHNILPFNGIWIDMNEPSNFATDSSDPFYWDESQYPNKSHVPALQCPTNERFDNPPYPTQAALYWGANTPFPDKTLCMIGEQGQTNEYIHYDVHSLYGWTEAEPTLLGVRSATTKRGIVISRSTYASSGQHTGHWLGDNNSEFADLRTSIVGMLEFSIFGIPYIGADICGFNGNTTEELCLRWMQLGAFYPFCRNHNGLNYIPQDPAQWPSVAEASRVALNFRYRYLPYLYTLHYKAHTSGEMVLKPVFFDFPLDDKTLTLDQQFLWGPAFMVAAVVEENRDSVNMYFPDATWYNIYEQSGQIRRPGLVTVPAPRNTTLPTYLKGGHIVPGQEPALNTTYSRLNPFELLVAVDKQNNSYGELYWDDGESIQLDNYAWFEFAFTANSTMNELTILMSTTGNINGMIPKSFDKLFFLGLHHSPNFTSLLVNGKSPTCNIGSVLEGIGSYTNVLFECDTLIPLGNATFSWQNVNV